MTENIEKLNDICIELNKIVLSISNGKMIEECNLYEGFAIENIDVAINKIKEAKSHLQK